MKLIMQLIQLLKYAHVLPLHAKCSKISILRDISATKPGEMISSPAVTLTLAGLLAGFVAAETVHGLVVFTRHGDSALQAPLPACPSFQ